MPLPLDTRTGGRPVAPSTGRLRPLGMGEVRLTGGFWADRQHVNATASLRHIEDWMEREGWIGNFDAARTGRLPEARRGREFSDSEVYKLLEAMAWEIGRTGDAELDARFTAIVGRIAPVQEQDGYLNTRYGRAGQPARYSDLEWGHELYCYGHLFQAAVARARTRGDDPLVDVARRAADHVCVAFGPDGIVSVCGHPEVETALVELGRVTGEQRYLDQAALFVERRGHGVLADIGYGRAYYQDDVPVREATVLRGHAVRANYLAAGAVDVAVETGDAELLAAVERQWAVTIARRTYVTGGQGSHHQDESYGDDFVLPPDRAYSETCAGVGSIMLAWRLLLATGEPRYADLVERTLYNVVATSPAADGRAFYYANTLHQRRPGTVPREDEPSVRASSSLRAPWFEVSCCPPNVARTLASLDTYLATADDDGVQVHQLAPAEVRTTLPDGRVVAFDVATAYPRDGVVEVRVVGEERRPWTLALRVPAWADGATLEVPGEPTRSVPAGTPATVSREFAPGDMVRLTLPVGPRFTAPDPRIDAVRGCLVVERGPEVLCVESVDLPDGGDVGELRLDAGVPPREEGGRVVVHARRVPADDGPWPYAPADAGTTAAGASAGEETLDVPLVAYHDWANRGPSTMRVWIPTL